MLSLHVSVALRSNKTPRTLSRSRLQHFRFTPSRNPNKINNLHTPKNHTSASQTNSMACALFQKHRGVYPPCSLSEFFLSIERDFQRFTASETGNATARPPAHAQSPTRTSTPSSATSTRKTSRRSMPESHTANSENPCS